MIKERLTWGVLGVVFALIVVAAIDVRGMGDDWRIFWHAGHTVGSAAILTTSHFAYTPGAAWFLWPFAQLSLATGYFLYVGLMVAAAVSAAWVASNLYRLSLAVAALMALAWWPFTIAICLGQNSPIALLLVILAIAAIVRRDRVLAGLSVGLLLYKPTDAVPLLLLFVIWKEWRSLGIVALSAAGWYALSASATNDWLWPVPYVHGLAALYRTDVAMNSDFAISVPTMLARFGMPAALGWMVGAAILAASVPLLLRVSRLEAASIMPLIGLAVSPHAWGYEAILALPALWLAASRLTVVRAALIGTAYAIAPIYVFSRELHFDALAIPVLGGAAFWLATSLSRRAQVTPAFK